MTRFTATETNEKHPQKFLVWFGAIITCSSVSNILAIDTPWVVHHHEWQLSQFEEDPINLRIYHVVMTPSMDRWMHRWTDRWWDWQGGIIYLTSALLSRGYNYKPINPVFYQFVGALGEHRSIQIHFKRRIRVRHCFSNKAPSGPQAVSFESICMHFSAVWSWDG